MGLMKDSLYKSLLTVSTLALCVIAVQMIPMSRYKRFQLLCAEQRGYSRLLSTTQLADVGEWLKIEKKISALVGYEYDQSERNQSDKTGFDSQRFCNQINRPMETK